MAGSLNTAVDTNIILDVIVEDAPHNTASETALNASMTAGQLVISETVAAELASSFADAGELRSFLDSTRIALVRSSPDALLQAGWAWRRYLAGRRSGVQCQQCGRVAAVLCEGCGEPIRVRQHLIADFMIGAHALIHADRLLTRDRGFFAAYFPELKLLTP